MNVPDEGQKKILRRFFANFCHEIGCENDLAYIFRFVKYLSTFFYTYLPINIHFQFIFITNIFCDKSRLLRPPSCFSGSLVLRSRDFSKYNPILTWPKIGGWKMSIIIFKNVQWKSLSENYHNKYLICDKSRLLRPPSCFSGSLVLI
jgi:hypothetical protein